MIQPTLWEDSTGVHMLIRSNAGKIYKSDSTDFGMTWCKAYETPYPNPNSGIDLVKLEQLVSSKSDHIIVYCASGRRSANAAQKLIDAIPNAENKEEAILIAKAAYDLLDADAKALITNADLLNQTTEKPKKGCKGSLVASVFGLVALLGACLTFKRKKD